MHPHLEVGKPRGPVGHPGSALVEPDQPAHGSESAEEVRVPVVGPVEFEMGDESRDQNDVQLTAAGDLVRDMQPVADGVADRRGLTGWTPVGPGSCGSLVASTFTSATNRYPRPCTVRISLWSRPSSPIARRACLIRLVTAASVTNRPPHTASMSSSLDTTRSRCETRYLSTSNVCGSIGTGRPSRRSSKRAVSRTRPSSKANPTSGWSHSAPRVGTNLIQRLAPALRESNCLRYVDPRA